MSAEEPSLDHVASKKLRGLGDVVEVLAKPIARGIDKLAGTDIENCEGCAERRERLNRAVPFTNEDGSSKGCVTIITDCLNCGRK